jgi:hypothetical protein
VGKDFGGFLDEKMEIQGYNLCCRFSGLKAESPGFSNNHDLKVVVIGID